MNHLGDICKINGAEIEPVWCITGGSPCQDLSVAGKRAGLAGERSGLFMEQVRIVKEMREHDKSTGRTGDMVRCRWLVWENVPGAFSSNGGEDFRAVLEEVVRIAEPTFSVPRLEGKWTKAGAIDGDGWSVAWRTHDAQYWGVPQRRRRISLVADFGGSSAGEILFERKSLSGDSQQSKPQRKETAGDSTNGTGVDDRVPYTLKIRGGVDKDANGKSAGKGALIQTDLSATLGVTQDQTLFQPICSFGHDERSSQMSTDEISDPLTSSDYKQPITVAYPLRCETLFQPVSYQEVTGCLSPGAHAGSYNGQDAYNDMLVTEKKCYGICSDKSNSMLSSNPNSGIYEADTSRTLDLNGGNPNCNQGGIAVCEPVNYSKKRFFDWEEDDKSVTLRNKGGSYGNGSEVLHCEPTLYDMTHANDVIRDCGGTCPTLQNRMGTGGNQVPVTVQKGLFYGKESNTEGIKALQTLWKDYGEKEVLQWGTSILERLQQADVLRQRMHEESIPLEGTQGNIVDDNSLPCEELVAEWILRDVRKQQECGCPSQRRKSAEQFLGEPSEIVPELPHQSTQTSKDLLDMWSKGEGVWILRQALSEIQKMGESSCGKTKWIRWIVRRLTPLEAERLQGYPDGWTDIGEWVDSKGKKHKEADSPRYKALGNSIALPFWYWMFCRMAKYLPEGATLGSLFDGIGGFPLCWENIHGKGTARWASEIEEFPIAVTKIRFKEE